MLGFAKEKTALLFFVSDGHLIALVMDKRTTCLRDVKRKMAKRQLICMSKLAYKFLNRIFTSFSSAGQKVLQMCPSLTKLLPCCFSVSHNCICNPIWCEWFWRVSFEAGGEGLSPPYKNLS